MSLVYVTGSSGSAEVYAATIVRPLVGVWHADLDVDASVALAGEVTIAVDGGALELVGVMVAGEVIDERQRVRVVGGKGRLSTSLPAKAYDRCQLRVPLYDVLSAVGERIASSSDASALSTPLARWTRTAGPAALALGQLVARVPGAVWRVTASGAVWVGTNAWPTSSLEHLVVEEDPARRTLTLASDDPTLTAGVVLDGRRIEHVVHRFTASGTRTECWYSA